MNMSGQLPIEDEDEFRRKLFVMTGLTEDAFVNMAATMQSNALRIMPAKWRARVSELALQLADAPQSDLGRKMSAAGDAQAGAWFQGRIAPELNKKGS